MNLLPVLKGGSLYFFYPAEWDSGEGTAEIFDADGDFVFAPHFDEFSDQPLKTTLLD